jgi:hypothetical protein
MMHSTGPWLFSPVNDCAVAIVEDDGTSIFDVTVGSHTTGQSALVANVNLITAAPDLLAALQALVGEADLGEIDHDDGTRALLAQARAAIARATGGQ